MPIRIQYGSPAVENAGYINGLGNRERWLSELALRQQAMANQAAFQQAGLAQNAYNNNLAAQQRNQLANLEVQQQTANREDQQRHQLGLAQFEDKRARDLADITSQRFREQDQADAKRQEQHDQDIMLQKGYENGQFLVNPQLEKAYADRSNLMVDESLSEEDREKGLAALNAKIGRLFRAPIVKPPQQKATPEQIEQDFNDNVQQRPLPNGRIGIWRKSPERNGSHTWDLQEVLEPPKETEIPSYPDFYDKNAAKFPKSEIDSSPDEKKVSDAYEAMKRRARMTEDEKQQEAKELAKKEFEAEQEVARAQAAQHARAMEAYGGAVPQPQQAPPQQRVAPQAPPTRRPSMPVPAGYGPDGRPQSDYHYAGDVTSVTEPPPKIRTVDAQKTDINSIAVGEVVEIKGKKYQKLPDGKLHPVKS